MQETSSRRRLLAGLSGLGTALIAGCTASTPFVGRRLESSRTIDPVDATAIRFTGELGEVTIQGTDRDDIAMDIVKQSSSITTDLEALSVTSKQENGTLTIETVYDGSSSRLERTPSVNLDVTLPHDLQVEQVTTQVGAIDVQNIQGDTTLETTTGRVTARQVDGFVSAETTTGRTEIRNIQGIGNIRGTTGRHAVDIPAIDGDTSVRTTTGQIAAAISSTLDAELIAAATTGQITIDGLSVDIHEEGDSYVHGILGDGGPTLRLETTTGQISITDL